MLDITSSLFTGGLRRRVLLPGRLTVESVWVLSMAAPLVQRLGIALLGCMCRVEELVEVEILKDSSRLFLILMRFKVILFLLAPLVLVGTDSFPHETVLVRGVIKLGILNKLLQ